MTERNKQKPNPNSVQGISFNDLEFLKAVKARAESLGFESLSNYIRMLARRDLQQAGAMIINPESLNEPTVPYNANAKTDRIAHEAGKKAIEEITGISSEDEARRDEREVISGDNARRKRASSTPQPKRGHAAEDTHAAPPSHATPATPPQTDPATTRGSRIAALRSKKHS